jgi:hypothetical protein
MDQGLPQTHYDVLLALAQLMKEVFQQQRAQSAIQRTHGDEPDEASTTLVQ